MRLKTTPSIFFVKKHLAKLLLSSLTLFMSAACDPEKETKTEEKTITSTKPATFALQMIPKYDTLVFHRVIFLDSLYTAYLNTISRDYENRNKLFIKMIADPVLKNFQKAEYLDFVKGSFSHAIQDTAKLRIKIAALVKDKEKIKRQIAVAYAKSNTYLRNDSMTFYVLPGSTHRDDILKRMGGVSGSTAGHKQTLLTIDPTMQTWDQVVEYTVAHEFNHAHWTKKHFVKNHQLRLIDFLIFEGKADVFAHAVYPAAKTPWITELTDTQRSEVWSQISANLNSEDQAYIAAVMYGSMSFPAWGGYGLGFDIVQTALKNNPDLKNQNWTEMDPYELLKLSGYKQ